MRYEPAETLSKISIPYYHNLFFYGTVGTGKSFLSGCVAKELIESGHSVIYFSTTGLFDLLSKNSFDYKNREELRET